MSSKLALFPLQVVVFPQERLPLHIFEERYKELIDDCTRTGKNFGIPVYFNNRLEYGTEVALQKVVQSYSSGAKDIICKGIRVFRVTNFEHEAPGKPYARGDVEFPRNDDEPDMAQKKQLFDLITELYLHLEVPPPEIEWKSFCSYTLAHKIGLSLQQEYALLKIFSEKKRLEFLINHLTISIPIIQEMNRAKQTIELNGHFRNFDPLDFREFRLKTR